MTDDINPTNNIDTNAAASESAIENVIDDTSPRNTIDIDTGIEDDITFEQDNETRENTRPDAMDKIAKLKTEIEKLKSEKQQYLDSWQRDKAEFVNARKRDEESKAEFLKFAQIGFVEELLPIIDSFESAIKHSELDTSTGGAENRKGLELIYNQFKSILNKFDVQQFGAAGEAFDPALHQAIGNVPLAENPLALDHTLAEVLQLGYKLQGKVIRPALVKVYQA